MGKCIYCGQKAGFLKRKHKYCKIAYNSGKQMIVENIISTIRNNSDFAKLEDDIKNTTVKCYIKENELPELYAEGFENTVDSFLNDGVLSNEEEEKIAKFKTYYNFDQDLLDKKGTLQKLFKASILRDVLDGIIPEPKIKVEGNLPFIFQKSEGIIWLFTDVEYYEQRSRTHYEGRSQGISLRIAKGVYYRTGSFKGHPVTVEEMKFLGKGVVILTNKHLYFGSSTKNIKIPYNKMITVNPYEDGIGMQKDGTNAKPQIFKGLDGWFTYNLISNLNQL